VRLLAHPRKRRLRAARAVGRTDGSCSGDADEQGQHDGCTPMLAQDGAHPHPDGGHSSLSTSAGFVRAAARAGKAAMRFAAMSAAGIMTRMIVSPTAGAGTTPIEPAKAVHTHRPITMPIGIPNASATRVRVVACQAIAFHTCRR